MNLKLRGVLLQTILGLSAISAFAQSDFKTTSDGVYSAEQAARGQAAFGQCGGCHGRSLEGGFGPALHEEQFMGKWRNEKLGTLFAYMKSRMPPNRAGSLPDNTYLDILTYILQSNNYPVGDAELKIDALGRIAIADNEAPKPPPTNSLVTVIGCIAPGANNGWVLASASNPIMLNKFAAADEVSTQEVERAKTTALGSLKFRMQNLADVEPKFTASAHKDQKVLVRGVIIWQPNNDRINVTAAAPLESSCGS